MATRVTVKVKVINRTAQWLQVKKPQIEHALDLTGAVVAQQARIYAPRKAGELQNAITHLKPDWLSDTRCRVRIGVFDQAVVGRALAHELGSGIHGPTGMKYLIVPRKAKVLYFQWINAPQDFLDRYGLPPDPWVSFTHVHHPGVKAQHFLERAMDDSDQVITDILRAALGG